MLPLNPIVAPDFFFPVYDDQILVLRLMSELRKLYPTSNLICVSDGLIANSSFIDACVFHAVKLIETPKRLKLPEFGGLWLERLFRNAISESDSPYIIRTEGDTRFWRRFRSLPEADVSGTLSHRYGFNFARNGCFAIKRTAVIKILRSGLLRSDEYRSNLKYSHQRYSQYYSQFRYAKTPVNFLPSLLSDLILGNVVNELGLSVSTWEEVDIQRRKTTGEGFAATHPHRLIG